VVISTPLGGGGASHVCSLIHSGFLGEFEALLEATLVELALGRCLTAIKPEVKNPVTQTLFKYEQDMLCVQTFILLIHSYLR
jgi:hypothetical protein